MLRETQQRNPHGRRLISQRSKGLRLQPALVGAPQALGVGPGRQQHQLPAVVAPGQRRCLVQHGLVIQTELPLQGHHHGEGAHAPTKWRLS